MRASVGQIRQGMLNYVDEQLIGRTPGISQWLLIAAVSMYAAQLENILAKAVQNPTLKQMGLVGEDGLIDVDMAKNALMDAAHKTGAVVQPIPFLGGVTFTCDDVESLYQHIMRV